MMAGAWMRRGWAGLAVAALGALPVAPGLAAQAEPAPRAERECRCLDAQGRERERCFCFAMPDDFAGNLIRMDRRAVLGVNVRQDQPARYDEQGARVYDLDESGPAGEAGLEAGDVVVAVDGRSLLDPLADRDEEDRLSDEGSKPVQRLLALLGDRQPGDSVRIEYLRDGERRTATVEMAAPRPLRALAPTAMAFGPMGRLDDLRVFGPPGAPGAMTAFRLGGDCPEEAPASDRRRDVVVSFGRSCVAGVELIEMKAGLSEYFGAQAGGVLVADASADNPLGLRAGDVLLAVDGRDVRGADHALRVLRSYEGDEEVDLRVLRKQETIELKGRVR